MKLMIFFLLSLFQLTGLTENPVTNKIDLKGLWSFKIDQKEADAIGLKEGWEKPGFDDSGWKRIKVGQSWESQKYNYNGVAWYRRKVMIPENWKSDIICLLGQPDDRGDVYFNGVLVAEVKKFGPNFKFKISKDLVNSGAENTIAVRIVDNYRGGGLVGDQFSLELFDVFKKDNRNYPLPKKQSLTVTENLPNKVIQKNIWEYGWRDQGTAPTMPIMSVERKAFEGKDVLVMDVKVPNSSEYIDYFLKKGERGTDWKNKGFNYISFWYKSEISGEIKVQLNKGRRRWKKSTTSFEATIFIKKGEWTQVILPFSKFIGKKYGHIDSLKDVSYVETLVLGYKNHELQNAGKIRFSNFQAGAFKTDVLTRPINLAGLWRFKLDNHRPDGTKSNYNSSSPNSKRDREGYGQKMNWHVSNFDDNSWDFINLPGLWEQQGYAYDGPAWFRQKVFIPLEWKGKALRLKLGQPDDRGELFFNGKSIQKFDSYSPFFNVLLTPENIKYGELNTFAIQISDWYSNGGILGDEFTIAPESNSLMIREQGKTETLAKVEDFDMGPKPGKKLELILKFYQGQTENESLTLDYQFINCFHRSISSGNVKINRVNEFELEAVVSLNEDEAKELYYGEWFHATALIKDKDNNPVGAYSWHELKLNYESRDNIALAPLDEKIEDTPYGKLKLIDVIDCSKNPISGEHPYKEGGIRESWVGRRAYSTWERGVTVESFKDRKYREVNNNEFFGYRIGRGKLKPNTGYVLRVCVPDNKARYFVMDIQAGTNYQGTGFRSGIAPDHPIEHYPQTGEYQWYDHLVMNDQTTYGYRGSRTTSSENGFWVFFHDNGRCYSAEHEAGPGVAEIRLYEVEDIEKHYPKINYPEGLPKRVLMMDWERQPEAPPADVAKWARFTGVNNLGPVFLKWAHAGFWHNELKYELPNFFKVLPEGEDDFNTYNKWLKATKEVNVGLVPRLEFGGGKTLPKEAWTINDRGRQDAAGRFIDWGANILHPATLKEFKLVLDDFIAKKIKDNPQITGILWRQRSDRIKCSYGKKDVELFCRETNRKMPQGNSSAIAKWASKTNRKAYHAWWQQKRVDFIKEIRDYIKTFKSDLVLYYYNWDEDGWNISAKNKASYNKQDFSDYYNIDHVKNFIQKQQEARKKSPDQHYVDKLTSSGSAHRNIYPDMFKNEKDIVIFAPVHWRYLADNSPYINYFQTGDGLAICNMFNYEEKSRWNIQGDRYESSEMSPGGHSFGMAEEIQAFFHGDPNVITWTTYTYGRGWIDIHRRFAQAFLSLPDMRGKVIDDALQSDDPEVKIRSYDSVNGTYISIVSKGIKSKSLNISLKAQGSKLINLVSGKEVPFEVSEGKISFSMSSNPMELNTYILKK